MEYVYAAMLLHSAKKEITEDAVQKILTAAGVEADPARIKALIASLKDVNIEEAIKSASAVAAAPAAAAPAAAEEKKEEKEEEKGKTEEEAAEGLGALFG
jgi:large subunit ribosomal protein L12